MRDAFAKAIIDNCRDNMIFLTGDLGFMALENVQAKLGKRFINCGVAEQNMVSVAAALAKDGFTVYAYSIAPFIYARPFEQIRNDIKMANAPVCIVGNGGGYGYGEMGPTHHALEDISAMNALGLKVVVPAFDDDLTDIISSGIKQAYYLRLGYDVKPKTISAPAYAPFRKLLAGNNSVWLTLGPLAGIALQVLSELPKNNRPQLYVVTELPIIELPSDFIKAVNNENLVIFEEHIEHGGLGMQMINLLCKQNISPKKIIHRYALGYPSGTYGSQNFHRGECELDATGMRQIYEEFYEKH